MINFFLIFNQITEEKNSLIYSSFLLVFSRIGVQAMLDVI